MDDELTFEQMYADLVQACANWLPERYFTVRQYAEDAEMAETTALRKLKAMADSGEIEGKKAPIDGAITWVFWFPEDNQ